MLNSRFWAARPIWYVERWYSTRLIDVRLKLNFTGSDTMSAAFHVQFSLNGGRPVATSIPAAEHSVIMAHPSERAALARMIEMYGHGVFACVLDSFDYVAALERLLPSIATVKTDRGGVLVLRPDSGDPAAVVLMALKAADAVFGSAVNKKGYRVLDKCAVIQGDGMNYAQTKQVFEKVIEAGFSVQNVAFGMGAALLQASRRSELRFFESGLIAVHVET